jgi:hypothetical protein
MENQITRRSNNASSTRDSTVTRTRRNAPVSEPQEPDQEQSVEGDSNNSSQPQEVKYRVGKVVSLGLIFLAGFFDLAELILSIFTAGAGGYIKDFAAMILFPGLFWIVGVPFWKGNKRVQKIITMVIAFIVSFIPYLSDIMPELLVSVVVTLMYTRLEDRFASQIHFVKKAASITRSRRR